MLDLDSQSLSVGVRRSGCGRLGKDPGAGLGVRSGGDRETCRVSEQRADAQLLGPGGVCAGRDWAPVGHLASDCSPLPGRPEAPHTVDGGGMQVEMALSDPMGRPLWSLNAAHALPSVGDKRELWPSTQAFLCTAPSDSPSANEVFWRAVKDH